MPCRRWGLLFLTWHAQPCSPHHQSAMIPVFALHVDVNCPCCLAVAVTPPGHYTDATGTYPCPSGYYRPGWVPYGDATTCIACGEGVKSAKTDQITLYNIITRKKSYKQVTTSSEDCCKCLLYKRQCFDSLIRWTDSCAEQSSCNAAAYGPVMMGGVSPGMIFQ